MRIVRANDITGWRRGSRLPGKPDFVFYKAKTAVFVDGCWSGLASPSGLVAYRLGTGTARLRAKLRRGKLPQARHLVQESRRLLAGQDCWQQGQRSEGEPVVEGKRLGRDAYMGA